MRLPWTGSLAAVALVAALAGAACGKKDTAASPDAPAVAAADKAGKPSIACAEAVYDFGTVQQGDEARHVFRMKNVGNALLKIDSARGG